MKHITLMSSKLIEHTMLTHFHKNVATSEVVTQKEHSSKNLQTSQKTRSSNRRCSIKIGVGVSF